MAIFYVTDWYPNTDNHFKAYCKICPCPETLLHTEFFRTGCGVELAFCSKYHLHTIKQIGPCPGQAKWIPLNEFCVPEKQFVEIE